MRALDLKLHENNHLIRTQDFQIVPIQDHSLLNASSLVLVQQPIIVVSSGGKVPILPFRQGHSVHPKAMHRQDCHLKRQTFSSQNCTLKSMYESNSGVKYFYFTGTFLLGRTCKTTMVQELSHSQLIRLNTASQEEKHVKCSVSNYILILTLFSQSLWFRPDMKTYQGKDQLLQDNFCFQSSHHAHTACTKSNYYLSGFL